jgi:hypothetical protein
MHMPNIRGWIRTGIALQLGPRLNQIYAAPCGSGSATLLHTIYTNIFERLMLLLAAPAPQHCSDSFIC